MSTGLGVQPHASWVTSSESFHYLDPQFLRLLSVLEMSKYDQLSELPSTKQALYVCVPFFSPVFFFPPFIPLGSEIVIPLP